MKPSEARSFPLNASPSGRAVCRGKIMELHPVLYQLIKKVLVAGVRPGRWVGRSFHLPKPDSSATTER